MFFSPKFVGTRGHLGKILLTLIIVVTIIIVLVHFIAKL